MGKQGEGRGKWSRVGLVSRMLATDLECLHSHSSVYYKYRGWKEGS